MGTFVAFGHIIYTIQTIGTHCENKSTCLAFNNRTKTIDLYGNIFLLQVIAGVSTGSQETCH